MILHIFDEAFVPLCVYFSTASSHHRQETVKRPDGIEQSCQLLFVLEGKGLLRIGGEELALKKGCAFFMDAGVPHEYENLGGLITAWITLRGEGLDAARRYIGHRSYLFSRKIDVSAYAEAIRRLEREYYTRKREGVMSRMAYAMAMDFFDECLNTKISDMERVLLYMEEHCREKIRVTDLAELCYCSVSTFCKRFKEEYSCTAFEKLVEIRLLNARTLLVCAPDEAVKNVAVQCGFEDASYFSKAYKKRFGYTPEQERSRKTRERI